MSYLDDCIVFVLPWTVVGVQVNNGCMETILLQIEVQHADDCIGSLTSISSFVYQEVYLLWHCFTTHTKDCTFPGCKKINGPRLERI